MSRMFTVYRKELLDVIRDRRTIISMVVIPIILFPVMTIGFGAFIGSQLQKSRAETQKVAVEGKGNYLDLTSFLSDEDGLEIVEVEDFRTAIKKKNIQAAVLIPDSAYLKVLAGDSAVVEIFYDAAEIKSEFARDKLRKSLRKFSGDIVKLRLRELGADVSILSPLPVRTENVASEEKMSGFILATILPYMIIILTMVGAMYPAIDLTAGEKERGTLETILASPASRLDIAGGKFLTVFTASIITALLSVTSLTLTASLGMTGMGDVAGEFSFKVQPMAFVVLVILMIPVSCLFSSVLMAVSLFAKSYKEAQSYITPLMFVVILPAMVGFIPGVELNAGLALVPIVNISLVAKEALMADFNWGYLGLVFLSTSIIAVFAVFVAKRQFDREEVLFRI